MQQLEHYFTHSLFSVEFQSSGERDLAMTTIAVDANCSSVCVSLCVSYDENIPLSLSLSFAFLNFLSSLFEILTEANPVILRLIYIDLNIDLPAAELRQLSWYAVASSPLTRIASNVLTFHGGLSGCAKTNYYSRTMFDLLYHSH